MPARRRPHRHHLCLPSEPSTLWGFDTRATGPTGPGGRAMTSTTSPNAQVTTLVVPEAMFTDPERLALAGFLAGYRGLTRDAYALDLRQFVSWCERNKLKLFSARRSDIELYARALEEAGRARATVARHLCTVAAFCRYAEEEGLLATSPAVHVRRPRLDYESHAIGLDRKEVGALLVAAGLGGSPRWPCPPRGAPRDASGRRGCSPIGSATCSRKRSSRRPRRPFGLVAKDALPRWHRRSRGLPLACRECWATSKDLRTSGGGGMVMHQCCPREQGALSWAASPFSPGGPEGLLVTKPE